MSSIDRYESILNFLKETYPSTISISRNEFRELLKISTSTDWRMYKVGDYPVVTPMRGLEFVLLTDLAAFLASDRTNFSQNKKREEKPNPKRGRPAGKPNRPKLPVATPSLFVPPVIM